MPDQSTLVLLLLRYTQNESLSAEECIILQEWLKESALHKELIEDLSSGNMVTADSIHQRLQRINSRKA